MNGSNPQIHTLHLGTSIQTFIPGVKVVRANWLKGEQIRKGERL